MDCENSSNKVVNANKFCTPARGCRFNDTSDYYDMNGFTHFNEDSIFCQPKKKTRRFDKTPSPIKFDLYQEYNPTI